MIKQLNKPHVLLFLHQIPGSYMKQVSFGARDEDGEIIKNSSGEKVIVPREWSYLLSPQRIALRRQAIGRADWEKLPWTGHGKRVECLHF